MNAPAVIARLQGFPSALSASISIASPDDLRWKPPSGNWSILEILCHLADEEVEDFRARLAFILEQREGPPSAIDPEGWATSRRYNEQDHKAVLARFIQERAQSCTWLQSLCSSSPPADWSLAYIHPKLGPLHAGDILSAWAAHDALHLRQIAKRLHEMAARDAAPKFQTCYAGEWTT